MRQIKINNVTYDMKLNLKALIAFERETKQNALDMNTFSEGKLEPIMQLGYAMIAANNFGKTVPSFDAFLDMVDDVSLVAEFVKTTSEELMEAMQLKPGDEPENAKKGNEPKNA